MIKEKDGGVLSNKTYSSDWNKNLDEFKLENSIKWKTWYCKKNK